MSARHRCEVSSKRDAFGAQRLQASRFNLTRSQSPKARRLGVAEICGETGKSCWLVELTPAGASGSLRET